MRNFIELHDEDNEPTLVNIDWIEKVFVNIDGLTTVELKDGYYRSRESYDEIAELIRGAGVCIDKGDPRLDTKSRLTKEDIKEMGSGEPVWNSNDRKWYIICGWVDLESGFVCSLQGADNYITYNEQDLIAKPLYRMRREE